MRNTQKALADLAYSIEADISEMNVKRLKSVAVESLDGSYLFNFEQEGFPVPVSDAYDVDIDIIPSHKKQAVITSLTAESFTFQILTDGVTFVDQAVNCSESPVRASIKVTYFETPRM